MILRRHSFALLNTSACSTTALGTRTPAKYRLPIVALGVVEAGAAAKAVAVGAAMEATVAMVAVAAVAMEDKMGLAMEMARRTLMAHGRCARS